MEFFGVAMARSRGLGLQQQGAAAATAGRKGLGLRWREGAEAWGYDGGEKHRLGVAMAERNSSLGLQHQGAEARGCNGGEEYRLGIARAGS